MPCVRGCSALLLFRCSCRCFTDSTKVPESDASPDILLADRKASYLLHYAATRQRVAQRASITAHDLIVTDLFCHNVSMNVFHI